MVTFSWTSFIVLLAVAVLVGVYLGFSFGLLVGLKRACDFVESIRHKVDIDVVVKDKEDEGDEWKKT